jgi:hypothetical protein
MKLVISLPIVLIALDVIKIRRMNRALKTLPLDHVQLRPSQLGSVLSCRG